MLVPIKTAIGSALVADFAIVAKDGSLFIFKVCGTLVEVDFDNAAMVPVTIPDVVKRYDSAKIVTQSELEEFLGL